MMAEGRRRWSRLAGWIVGLGLVAGSGARAQVTPVPQLDLRQFAGTWYEVARQPDKEEKRCVSDGVRLYALSDKPRRFQGVNTCKIKKGYPDVRNKDGKVQHPNGDGSLETSYLLFFHKRTWVIAIAPDYSWAVMGSPDHRTLWLLSRKAKVDPEVMTEMKARATSQGFDVNKLIPVAQGR